MILTIQLEQLKQPSVVMPERFDLELKMKIQDHLRCDAISNLPLLTVTQIQDVVDAIRQALATNDKG